MIWLGKHLSALLLNTSWGALWHTSGYIDEEEKKKGFLPSGLEKVMREQLPALAIAVEQSLRAGIKEEMGSLWVMNKIPGLGL